jgi:hypothetical protein
MQYINSRTLLKQTDGYLSYRGTGEVVQTPDEASYFAALGLAWIAPAGRCAAALKRAVRRNGAARTGQQEVTVVRRCVDDETVRAYIRARLEANIREEI